MSFSWQRTGGWTGGLVTAVAFSPNVALDGLALAATAAGVYRSTDGGATWTLSTTGLSDPDAIALAFVEQPGPQGQPAFVATRGGRLFVSRDSGQSWAELTAWAGLGVITTIALSPNYREDQTLFVATDAGIFRSQAGGQQWESCTFGLYDLEILCLACAPDFASSEVLWTGTAQGGFYRSRNGGRSWRDAGAGLPDAALSCLLVSPHFGTDQTLWVGTEANGLYRSLDGGASWARCGEALAEQSIYCLASTPDGHALIAGTDQGVYWSADGGQTWTASPSGEFTAFALATSSTGLALASAVQEGMYLSVDAGKAWQCAVTGLAAHTPPVVSRLASGALYALDEAGILAYSADQGVHWQTLNEDPDLLLRVFTVAKDVAENVADDAQMGQLYAMTAAGQLYQRVADGLWQQRSLVAWPSTAVCSLLLASPAFAQDQTLVLGDEAGQLYFWHTAAVQLRTPAVPWLGEALLQLAFSPLYGVDRTLCAVTAQPDEDGHYRLQLWRSPDAGQSWETWAELQTELPAVALAWPLDPVEQALFLATRNRVIKIFIRTTEQQWAVEQTFLAEGLSVTALAVAPDYGVTQSLFAATNHGVYQRQANNEWTAWGTGLAARAVVALFPAAEGELMAVTLGGEIWHGTASA